MSRVESTGSVFDSSQQDQQAREDGARGPQPRSSILGTPPPDIRSRLLFDSRRYSHGGTNDPDASPRCACSASSCLRVRHHRGAALRGGPFRSSLSRKLPDGRAGGGRRRQEVPRGGSTSRPAPASNEPPGRVRQHVRAVSLQSRIARLRPRLKRGVCHVLASDFLISAKRWCRR